MRQLIARIDDRLHARLKARAKTERRSLNALVTELLARAVEPENESAQVLARMKALGLLRVFPPPARRPPSRDAAIEMTRGAGSAVSEALEADRAHR